MTGSFVSPELRARVRGAAVPVALMFGRIGLTPNALTVIGFAGTCVAAWAAAAGQWLVAGVLVVSFGIFDLFDGALARATGRASRFGAFLDSTLDRTGESLVLAGIAVGAAAADFLPATMFAGLALTFASGVTYTRAKAESLGVHGEVGFAPREVRLVLLAATLVVTGILGPARPGTVMFPMDATAGTVLLLGLGSTTVLSAVTIVQRILHIKHQLEPGDVPTSNREHA